jgi:hypothetical protein
MILVERKEGRANILFTQINLFLQIDIQRTSKQKIELIHDISLMNENRRVE